MSGLVKARRAGIVAGIATALVVVTMFLARPVPDRIVALVGGPQGGVDRIGGARIRYQPAPGTDIETLEFPAVSKQEMRDLQDVLIGGGLAMHEVIEETHAGEIAFAAGVRPGRDRDTGDLRLEIDHWRAEAGPFHTMPYLEAHSREALEGAVALAASRGVRLPSGSELGFERIDGATSHYWRTYELDSAVLIDDARARREQLAPAGVLHQIQRAAIVEHVLADAGIACHLHASNLRTLFAFFGPFAPVTVLVPEARAVEARAKIEGATREARARLPKAAVRTAP